MHLRLLFTLLLFFAVASPCYPVTINHTDSARHEVKQFSQSTIQSYKADREFNYEPAPIDPGESLWTMIKYYWFKLLERALGSSVGNVSVYDMLLYSLILFAAIMIVLQLFKVRVQGLFAPGPAKFNYKSEVENILELDLDTQVKQAITNSNYRLAIRIQYLKALRQLTEAGLIKWQKNKTNFEYYYELKDENIRRRFYDLTSTFEYAWYGEFRITEDFYKKNADSFTGFIQSIRK